MLQAGAVEPLNAVGGEQIPVGDQPGDHAAAADMGNDIVQLRMQQRFAAADGDDVGTETGEMVQTPAHHVQRDRLGMIVILVAISTGQIAAAHGDYVRQNRVVPRDQPARDHP